MLDPNMDSMSTCSPTTRPGISRGSTRWIIQMAGLVLGIEPNQTFDMTADELEQCKQYCIDKGKNLYNIWVNYQDMGRRAERQRVPPTPGRMPTSR
jgi:hypothetical protein